jgi:hypothetical protein
LNRFSPQSLDRIKLDFVDDELEKDEQGEDSSVESSSDESADSKDGSTSLEANLKAKEDSRTAKRKMVALERVLNDMAMKIFPYGERAARLQKKYLCNMGLTMNGMDVTAFARRLEQLSSYQPYFPMRLVSGKPVKPEPITEEQLVEALHSAIPERWNQMILRTGSAPEDFASIREAVTYYV